jgi:hypothetical protein
MANIKNLEIGVERAMKAYLREKGVSAAATDQRVKAKLAQGVAFVRSKFAAGEVDPDLGATFAQLKVWTLANV